MWLIEAHSKASNVRKACLYGLPACLPVSCLESFPLRPQFSQVVGAVRFGDEVIYRSREEFHSDFHRHLVPTNHSGGWPNGTELKAGWIVQDFVSVKIPHSLRGERLRLFSCNSKLYRVAFNLRTSSDGPQAKVVPAAHLHAPALLVAPRRRVRSKSKFYTASQDNANTYAMPKIKPFLSKLTRSRRRRTPTVVLLAPSRRVRAKTSSYMKVEHDSTSVGSGVQVVGADSLVNRRVRKSQMKC